MRNVLAGMHRPAPRLWASLPFGLLMVIVMAMAATPASASGAPTVSIADASAQEGGALYFTVSVSTPIDKPIKMGWRISDAEAQESDGDYPSGQSGHVKIKPRTTSTTVRIRTTQDSKYEPDERISVRIFPRRGSYRLPADVVVGKDTAFGTIRNDDAQPPPEPVVAAAEPVVAAAEPAVVAAEPAAPAPSALLLLNDDAVCEKLKYAVKGLATAGSDEARRRGILAQRGCTDPDGWLGRYKEEPVKIRAERQAPAVPSSCTLMPGLCHACRGSDGGMYSVSCNNGSCKMYAYHGSAHGRNLFNSYYGHYSSWLSGGKTGGVPMPGRADLATIDGFGRPVGAEIGTCTYNKVTRAVTGCTAP